MLTSFSSSKSLGFSLIETLIAISLSLLLVSFLFSIYLASERSYKAQNQLNQIEQQAKQVLQILHDEIKQAGFTGCQRLTKNNSADADGNETLTIENKLNGSDNTITIRHATPVSVMLKEVSYDKKSFTTSKEVHFAKGDKLIITDCKKMAVVSVAKSLFNQSGQIIILAAPLHQSFSESALVSRFEINKFFIAKTKRQDANKRYIYSLFVEDIKGRKTELVEGIASMQFTFANDQSSEELTATLIKNWSYIKGVFIRLEIYSGPLQKIWYGAVAL